MRVLPKLRCPCCGKLSFFPNFTRFHKVEAFVLRIKGLGRGKGFRNTYERDEPKDLVLYWIDRLKEVIKYLEREASRRNLNLILKPVEGNYTSVLEKSALNQTVALESPSTPTLARRVPGSWFRAATFIHGR